MDRNHVTGKILNLTLKIIYLLTGEDYVPIKKCDDDNITEPSSPAHEKETDEKILDLTNKIIELLTGEGEHLKEVKDEPTSNTEEDALVWAALKCKEEEIPMNISTDHSSENCAQKNDYGIHCDEAVKIAPSVSSGNSEVNQSDKRPVDTPHNITDVPDGGRMDSLQTMNANLNIVLIHGGPGDLRFKEEEVEIPIGARSDGSKNKLQNPPPRYLEDEASDDSETEEDEIRSKKMKGETFTLQLANELKGSGEPEPGQCPVEEAAVTVPAKKRKKCQIGFCKGNKTNEFCEKCHKAVCGKCTRKAQILCKKCL